FFDKVYRHRYEEPEPLEKVRPDVPPLVAALVRKLMAKRPEDRCQTPAEVAAALAAVLCGDGGTTAALPQGVRSADASSADALDSAFALTDEPGDTTPAVPPRRRRTKAAPPRWLGYAASGGLSLLIGAGLLVLLL